MALNPFDGPLSEVERYELREIRPIQFEPNRRAFVQTLGAGLIVAVSARGSSAQRRGGRNARRDEPLSARFHVGIDGVVTVFTSKVEVGQGARTQITQAAAEELRLPLSQIRLVMADTQSCPDDGGTAGSRTTPSTVPRMRSAAAAAREAFVSFAAEHLGVDRAEVTQEEDVFRTREGKQVTLAELAVDGQSNPLRQAGVFPYARRRDDHAGRSLARAGDTRSQGRRPRDRNWSRPVPVRHHPAQHALRQSASTHLIRCHAQVAGTGSG